MIHAQESLPLRIGDHGAAVDDLHDRLRRAGEDPGDDAGYDRQTEQAVRRFQESRAIRIDGICGRQTWSALVEAGWRLGDRLLFERQPMQRGDDVADLQHRLGGLGFLDDRVDGFFGPRTRQALQDFQRNTGVTVDGICGPETIASLVRLGTKAPSTQVKAGIIERADLLSRSRHLRDRRIVVGDLGGAAALVDSVERALHATGADTTITTHPDGSVHAREANSLGADVFVGLSVGSEPRCAFYATTGFRSYGGERLAALLSKALSDADALDAEVPAVGMRLPVLRETRMPAVVCELAPARTVVEQSATLTELVRAVLTEWAADPEAG